MKKDKSLIASFELTGCLWEVRTSPDILGYGYCDNETHRIVIKDGMTDQSSGVTLYHELMHAMLYSMGHGEHDEKFVDAMAHLLYQFSNTFLSYVKEPKK